MIANLKYIDLEYTEKDLEYIEYLKNNLDSICEEVVNFFNVEELEKKVNVKIYGNLEEFRKKYEEVGYNLTKAGKTPTWVCGFTTDETSINTLCLEEYNKTRSHENDTLEDLLHLILHEFVHAINFYVDDKIEDSYLWLVEGLATTISHQYDNAESEFNASLEDIINGTSYSYYHTMFKYVLDTYGKDYINKLINDHEFLYQETPKLYNGVKEKYEKIR